MTRVLLLFEYPTLNGGEQSLLAVLPLLAARDFSFVALAPREGRLPAALADVGIEILPLETADEARHRLPQAAVRAQIRAAIDRVEPDLLHANSLSMGRLAGPVTADVPLPSIAHLRDIVGLSKQAVSDLNQSGRFLAVSQATRDYHVAQGLDAARTFVAYNGIDLDRFHPAPSTGWLHRELGLPTGAAVIGSIGQLVLRKGHDVLAEAAAMLAERLPNVHYVLVGDRFSDKAEAREHEAVVRARFATGALAGRGHFLGFRPGIPELLAELTLLVHPARQEPLGRVLLEAAASGVPIVATDVGGTREILPTGTAELVGSDRPQALAGGILKLIDNASLRETYAAAALSQIRARFDARLAADTLARHYHEVLAAATKPHPT